MNEKSNIVGTGEFYFSPGATSAANAINIGYIPFGNLQKVSFNPVIEANDHILPRRGISTRGKTHVTKAGLMIQAEMHDVTWNAISTLFGSETAYGSSLEDGASGSAAAGANIVIPSTLPAGSVQLSDHWFQITNTSGVPFTNITAVTLTRGSALTQNVDYELNARTGQVRFKSTAVSLGDTVTVSAVTAGGTATARLQGGEVGMACQKEGIGQVAIFGSECLSTDQVYAELIHEGFLCKVTVDGNNEVDPNSPQTIGINIKVLDLPGKVWLRTN